MSTPPRTALLTGAGRPIGRLITVDEVSQAVLFCLANGGLTGQGVNVDGGAVQS